MECPFLDRRGREAGERRPDSFLDLRRHQHLFVGEQRANPLGGPCSLVSAVDVPQGLEGNGLAAVVGMTAVLAAEAERMMRTAHRQHRSTCRESLRSEEHTSELQSLMRISYAVFCLK